MSLKSIYLRAPAPLQAVFLNAVALRIRAHRYGPAYRRAVRQALQRESWDRSALREFQDHRLRSIIDHAYGKSTYYRMVFDESGVHPRDVTGVADLSRLPLLTKEVLRENLADILTAPRPRSGWLHGHTSGTTGSPLSLWYDRETAILNNAMDQRQKAWGGMADPDWIGLFLGQIIVSPQRHRPPFWQPNYVLRQVWFSTFHLSDENLPDYIEEIRRRGLRFLEGYPSTLFILAKHLLETGERLPMRSVFTSSETLHRIQRETIEEAFQCRIFDFYGHAERVIFATECDRHEGKHLSEEYGYTEVVDHQGEPVAPGTLGYLVGTSLENRAMPMIRYRTGDLSRIIEEPCPCGRTSRRIVDVSTKAEDIVVTPDGRLLSPSILTHPFKPFDQIRKSQIIQEAVDRIVVRLVPSDQFDTAQEEALKAGLRERLGEGVMIDVQRVGDIPREASGKYRWVISKVDHAAKLSWGVDQ